MNGIVLIREDIGMTGSELIEWIKEHHAEQLKAIVQFSNTGSIYSSYDDVSPCLCVIKEEEDHCNNTHEVDYRITDKPNAFSL